VYTRDRNDVAVLLATYNGVKFVKQQISSLTQNSCSFALHWIDDHSTDDTRNAVCSSARETGIDLSEWSCTSRQGYPATFLHLLEKVQAYIYLFCDQDDIWQPGKIDVTVANLLPDVGAPALCFSEPLLFNSEEPQSWCSLFEVLGVGSSRLVETSRSFTFVPAVGNTIGLTRPLRDVLLTHIAIARRYAFAHDWWMYILGLSLGNVRLLTGVPTTLWRQHENNFSAAFFRKRRRGVGRFPMEWKIQPLLRRWYARQAQGFLLASETLPRNPTLDKLLQVARLVAAIESRQSFLELIRLFSSRAMPPRNMVTLRLLASCLCSDVSEFV